MRSARVLLIIVTLGCSPEVSERRVARLEAQLAELSERVDARYGVELEADTALDRRVTRIEERTPGIGYSPLAWRTLSRDLSTPDVRAYPGPDGQGARITALFTFRSSRCPTATRTKVFVIGENLVPVVVFDERVPLSAECSIQIALNESWLLLERIEFSDR